MFKQTLIAAAAAALLAAAMVPAAAQQSPPPAAKREMRVYGEEVMTPQERQAYVDRMRAAKTREDRIKLRDEHRAEMQQRAKEKGVTLQEPQRRGGEKGGAKGDRKGAPSPAEQLFSEQERADFRQRMQDAKTPEERDRIRGEMRTQAEARAKEKGVTLPEPRGPRGAKPAPAPEAPKAQ